MPVEGLTADSDIPTDGSPGSGAPGEGLVSLVSNILSGFT